MARLFIYNTTNTISNSYGVFIVLAISGVLAAIGGIAYLSLLNAGRKKRSPSDDQDRATTSDLLRPFSTWIHKIVELAEDEEEDKMCALLRLCQQSQWKVDCREKYPCPVQDD